ncbi:hypothetical protein Dimus_014139 [Dionaea muscipula]
MKVLDLDCSWWVNKGVSMTPWSEDLVLLPSRDVWIRCLGVTIHARCHNTFLPIGSHWGDVQRVEFGSMDSGDLDDGRIFIQTKVIDPLFFYLHTFGRWEAVSVLDHGRRRGTQSVDAGWSRSPWDL